MGLLHRLHGLCRRLHGLCRRLHGLLHGAVDPHIDQRASYIGLRVSCTHQTTSHACRGLLISTRGLPVWVKRASCVGRRAFHIRQRASRVIKWAFCINQGGSSIGRVVPASAMGPPVSVRGLLHQSGNLLSQGTFCIGQKTSYINQRPSVSARGPPVYTRRNHASSTASLH